MDAARARAGDRARAGRRRSRASSFYFFAIAPVLAATVVGGAGRLAGAGRRRGAAGHAVGPRGRGAGRRWHRVQPSARGDRGLVRPAVGAAGAGRAGVGGAAVVEVDLNVNKPAKDDGALFRRKLSAPYRDASCRSSPAIRARRRWSRSASPSRPSLFLDATPERTPWVTMDDVRKKGAIVVWPTADTAGTPPPDIKAAVPRPRAGSTATPPSSGRSRDGCRCCGSAGR